MTVAKFPTVALALAIVTNSAFASDEFPLAGHYLQNRPCTGNGHDPAELQVTITAREIVHSGGACSIDSERRHENQFNLRVTCTFRSGSVMGADIIFTRRDDASFNMAQQDGSYRAVLYRCPK